MYISKSAAQSHIPQTSAKSATTNLIDFIHRDFKSRDKISTVQQQKQQEQLQNETEITIKNDNESNHGS